MVDSEQGKRYDNTVLRHFFNYTQRLNTRASALIVFLLYLRNLSFRITSNRSRIINLEQFTFSNGQPAGAQPSPIFRYPEIEILFVSTQKDFSILGSSILGAIKVTSHHPNRKIYVVVPDSEVELANEAVGEIADGIQVLAESNYLNREQMLRIRGHFGSRSGWVIQQILKVEHVSRSKSPGVLVVDSDTILLEPREWLSSSEVQILTPSWEWHVPYYDFLAGAGFSINDLKHSYISHHMLMQPKYMIEAREYVAWENTDDLIDYLVTHSNPKAKSPFCIEFELYAQYMLLKYSEKIKLVKWSNLGIPRNELAVDEQLSQLLPKFQNKYASISLHSYL